MGLFRKKSDPISQRAKEINKEIAKIQSEIEKLALDKSQPEPDKPAQPEISQNPGPQANPSPQAELPIQQPYPDDPPKPPLIKPDPADIPKIGSDAPKLRTTTTPDGITVPAAKSDTTPEKSPSPKPASDPIFEDLSENPFRPAEKGTKEQEEELGLKQDDLAASWKRMKNHLKGPATTNPKLVNYLAAGSIQGLRPLRYERRVARNRFIVLAAILALILWGILALLLRN